MTVEQENKIINLWKFIEFAPVWEKCNTSKLDEISPSWFRRKDELEKTSSAFADFMERLKRQHAIETGIVERMYDISKGTTETLIEKGFAEMLISHGDYSNNVTKEQLMNHLKDHLSAVDFVFDFVKNNRELTIGFIKELHQVVTAHQDFAEGRDQFGNKHKIPLIKGKFKERENNPSRQIGNEKITYNYCPPEHTDAEMDNLILIYNDLLKRKIHPVIIAAWFHHSFSIVHPFQDGNGRLARLLASLIFIKFNLFPLTVLREDAKDIYIKSLEDADNGNPQPLVNYFCERQKHNIERVLNLKPDMSSSFSEVVDFFVQKLETKKQKQEKEGGKHRLDANRKEVFDICKVELQKLKSELELKLDGNTEILIGDTNFEYLSDNYSDLITQYSEKHKYFFNKNLPKAYFQFMINIIEKTGINLSLYKRFDLIIPLHHYGYDDSTLAIGGGIEYIEKGKQVQNIYLPLTIEPFIISLEMSDEEVKKSSDNIKDYLQQLITLTLAQIASEIT